SHGANAEPTTQYSIRSCTRGRVSGTRLAYHTGKHQSRCCDKSGNNCHADNGQDRRPTDADSIACQHVSSEGGPGTGSRLVNDEYDSHMASCDRGIFDASLHHRCGSAGAAHLCLLAVYSPWTFPITARCVRLEERML